LYVGRDLTSVFDHDTQVHNAKKCAGSVHKFRNMWAANYA
jgi:hypothetical protein